MRTACESYHLPEHLTRHVDFVTPTVHFDAKLTKHSTIGRSLSAVGLPSSGAGPKTSGIVLNWDQLADCDTHITPSCLRALYGFWYEPVVPEKNSYGIGGCGNVSKRSLVEVAYSRVYPAVVPSGRSQHVRQELLLGSLWCQPCHGLY